MILTPLVVRVLIMLIHYETFFRNRLVKLLEQFAVIDENIFDDI